LEFRPIVNPVLTKAKKSTCFWNTTVNTATIWLPGMPAWLYSIIS